MARTAIIIIIFLLPNIIFGVAAYLGVGRDLVNIDYAVPIMLAVIGWLPVAIIVGVFVVIVDVLLLVMQVFPFIRLTDVFYFLNMANLASPIYQVAIAASFLIPVGVILGVVFFARRQSLVSGLAFLNLCILGYAAVIYLGGDSRTDRFWRVGGEVFGSASLYFYNHRMSNFVQGNLKSSVNFEDASEASIVARQLASKRLDPIILFVINESWGVLSSPTIQKEILEPISDFVSEGGAYGESAFIGATVSAELKELCGVMPDSFSLRYVKEGLEKCLPRKYADNGYATYALHGAMGVTYDRKDWYPKAGFENLIFYESKPWPRRCFSFPGACDIDLAKEISDIIRRDEEQKFIYWLTLNSHSIYDPRDIILAVDDCASFGLEEFPQSCRNVQLQQQFFKILASVFDGYSGPPIRVVIVGDHEPPIVNQVEKDAVYIRGKVPWVDFVVVGES